MKRFIFTGIIILFVMAGCGGDHSLTNFYDDGNIFVYGRNGKAIRKINRKGQGGEEYVSMRSVSLDEENEEIFVNDFHAKKIRVYDLEGNFK